MKNIFSASEVVEMGVRIEKNGKDFYDDIAKSSKNQSVKEVFGFLSREEGNHIKRFENILSKVEKYEPKEAYPDDYFAYIKSLSSEHVFTKEKKGSEIAKSTKTDSEAIELGIGFEKDSILFYNEMKKFVLEGEWKVIDKLIEE